MPDLVPVRRALISVSDKTGLDILAEGLRGLGVEIVSTGGTAAALAATGTTVIRVEELTGFPEMMEGRVKSLHPAIHGALLARRDVEGDRAALAAHGITPIDLVCVNLYPFEETVGRPGVTEAETLEQIDIGGPTLLRSAAKNHPWVAVITSPDQYDALLDELGAHGGATTASFRRALAAAAFDRTARYDRCIGVWLGGGDAAPGRSALRYGENPHQQAWLEAEAGAAGASIPAARVLHGKPLSYNNIQDAAAALELVRDLHELGPDRASACIVKHTNACGAGTAPDLPRAFDLAYEGDPLAAYGGILALDRAVDEATARRVCNGRKFFEVIVAPDYEPPALAALGERWKNVRLLAVGDLAGAPGPALERRSIAGGTLVQERDATRAWPGQWTHAAGPGPAPEVLADAAFAWTVVKHLKSNAVAIAAGGQLLGAGCGLVDRVTACRLAVEKAGDRLRDRAAVAASDAFFPFADGPKILIDAGVTCIVHPGGSKRDRETLDLCGQRGVTCLLTGIRHFRH